MIVSEYRLADGEFTNRSFNVSDKAFLNTLLADGCAFKDGMWNPELHRVDLATGDVIQPDAAVVHRYGQRPPGLRGNYATWDRAAGDWTYAGVTLAQAKMIKADEIRVEGAQRIRTIFPALSNIDDIKLLRELYLSIAPAARQPTADMTRVINVWQAARDAIAAVNTAATRAAVDAVTPAWPA